MQIQKAMNQRKFYSAHTLQYFVLTLTLHASFIYMNTVFFIYKYKQLYETMPNKFSNSHLPFFFLPTLTYFIVRYSLSTKLLMSLTPEANTVLLILASAYIKMIAYVLDNCLTICVEFASLMLIIMNFAIAYIDSYLYATIERLYYAKCISVNIVVHILFNELPNYLFAFIFNVLESLVYRSCIPYFDIVAVLYLIVAICNYFSLSQETKSKRNCCTNLIIYNHKKCNNKEFLSTNYRRAIQIYKILCTISETVIYFFLMSTMKEQNFLVMYFSFEFLFKIVNYIPKEKHLRKFFVLKAMITASTLYFVLTMKSTADFGLTSLLFISNGLTNQVVYRCYEKVNFTEDKTIMSEMTIFGVVSVFVLYFAQKKEETFEDFIFFSAVRL